jgi:hypothetical protein
MKSLPQCFLNIYTAEFYPSNIPNINAPTKEASKFSTKGTQNLSLEVRKNLIPRLNKMLIP